MEKKLKKKKETDRQENDLQKREQKNSEDLLSSPNINDRKEQAEVTHTKANTSP